MSSRSAALVSDLLALMCLSVFLLPGCPPFSPDQPCPSEDPAAAVNVAGTYRYGGTTLAAPLVGTITFAQEGDLVTVTGTTYENAADRDLTGSARLSGNVLVIQLVPKDGTFYRADLRIVFTPDGNEFCVEFSDTNGDAGEYGSYRGVRQ